MEDGITLVHDTEYSVGIFVEQLILVLVVAFPEVIALPDHLGEVEITVKIVRNSDLIFHEISLFRESFFQEHRLVVGSVVLSVGGGKLVETFDKNSGDVKLKETDRAFNDLHSFFLAIFLHPFHQGVYHLLRFDEVYPAETADLLVNLFVVLIVYDAGDSADNLAVFIVCQPIFPFADLKGPVFARSEGVHFHRLNLRNVVFVVRVQLVREPDETPQILSAYHFLGCNSHCFFA